MQYRFAPTEIAGRGPKERAARARKHADQEAEHAPPHHGPSALGELPERDHDTPDRGGGGLAALTLPEELQHLADGEQAESYLIALNCKGYGHAIQGCTPYLHRMKQGQE